MKICKVLIKTSTTCSVPQDQNGKFIILEGNDTELLSNLVALIQRATIGLCCCLFVFKRHQKNIDVSISVSEN